jgi:hypothetical protein
MKYVRTSDIRGRVNACEERIFDALGISGGRGTQHIDYSYPSHDGKEDWRWDRKLATAYCSCSRSDSIFDVVMKCEGLADFEETKIWVTTIPGSSDIIRSRGEGQQFRRTDAASLAAPPPEAQDDNLVLEERRLSLISASVVSTYRRLEHFVSILV